MHALLSTPVTSRYGQKELRVCCGDITALSEPIDILITSAYYRSYHPAPGTVFHALARCGISIAQLAQKPAMDLRELCNVWLSREITGAAIPVGRLACVEFMGEQHFAGDPSGAEHALITSIRALFQMLDTASIYGIPMQTIALPLLGSGRQSISAELTMIPILNECIAFLQRNEFVKRILFVEYNREKATLICNAAQSSYQLQQHRQQAPVTEVRRQPLVFISYASPDRNIADNLCAKLESRGFPVWYAPRNVKGAYADAITDGIERATHFVVILSQNSMRSQHVLNEIDLAFQKLPDKIKFKPLRIDDSLFTPSFKYYLSRQHWMDAIDPPLEQRLTEFASELAADL